jgi:uncharacterized repeat protein (TIGR04076 family)
MAATNRKARVTVTKAFGTCPIGYHEGDAVTIDLDTPERGLRCPGVEEALQPYIEVAERNPAAQPMEFAASCQCPYSKSEVVFHMHVFPSHHEQATGA